MHYFLVKCHFSTFCKIKQSDGCAHHTLLHIYTVLVSPFIMLYLRIIKICSPRPPVSEITSGSSYKMSRLRDETLFMSNNNIHTYLKELDTHVLTFWTNVVSIIHVCTTCVLMYTFSCQKNLQDQIGNGILDGDIWSNEWVSHLVIWQCPARMGHIHFFGTYTK